jgi:tetratricopeptide (TPR) repeat protein
MRSDAEKTRLIRAGIDAVMAEEYLAAFNLLSDVYATPQDIRHADGLSYLGLCLALVEKNYDGAIDLCQRAIEMRPGETAHYVNLVRVYVAAGKRKQAVSLCDDALKILPSDDRILALRQELGVRAQPPVPFLSRENPINQALGRTRHAKKVQSDEPVMRGEAPLLDDE